MNRRDIADLALRNIRKGYENWLKQTGRKDDPASRRLFSRRMLLFLETLYQNGGRDDLWSV